MYRMYLGCRKQLRAFSLVLRANNTAQLASTQLKPLPLHNSKASTKLVTVYTKPQTMPRHCLGVLFGMESHAREYPSN